jgi:hypothetical protein
MTRTDSKKKPSSKTPSREAGSQLLGQPLWKHYGELQAVRTAAFDRERMAQIAKEARRSASKATGLSVSPVVEKARAALELQIKQHKAWSKPKVRSKGHAPIASPRSWPPWWREIDVDVLFYHTGNYGFATPNPQVFTQTPNNYLKGIGSTTIAEYADPLTGSISLGFAGGDFRNNAGGIFSASPMTEQWKFPVPHDGISVSASIYQLADISNLAKNTGLIVAAGLQCPVRNSNPNDPDQSFEGLFDFTPGLASSALSGLVSVEGYFSLTVSSSSNGQMVNSATNTATVFRYGLISINGPGGYGGLDYKLVYDECVFTAPETVDQTVYLNTPLTIGTADQLIVEVQVRLVGIRGGIADPGAGFLGVKFQDDYHPVTPVDLGLLGYACPFRVVNIGAFRP